MDPYYLTHVFHVTAPLHSLCPLPTSSTNVLHLIDVTDACQEHKAVYFGATGGAGALLGKQIKSAEVIAYEELGPEAVRKLEVVDFPVTVINDTHGEDLYKIGRAQYEIK